MSEWTTRIKAWSAVDTSAVNPLKGAVGTCPDSPNRYFTFSEGNSPAIWLWDASHASPGGGEVLPVATEAVATPSDQPLVQVTAAHLAASRLTYGFRSRGDGPTFVVSYQVDGSGISKATETYIPFAGTYRSMFGASNVSLVVRPRVWWSREDGKVYVVAEIEEDRSIPPHADQVIGFAVIQPGGSHSPVQIVKASDLDPVLVGSGGNNWRVSFGTGSGLSRQGKYVVPFSAAQFDETHEGNPLHYLAGWLEWDEGGYVMHRMVDFTSSPLTIPAEGITLANSPGEALRLGHVSRSSGDLAQFSFQFTPPFTGAFPNYRYAGLQGNTPIQLPVPEGSSTVSYAEHVRSDNLAPNSAVQAETVQVELPEGADTATEWYLKSDQSFESADELEAFFFTLYGISSWGEMGYADMEEFLFDVLEPTMGPLPWPLVRQENRAYLFQSSDEYSVAYWDGQSTQRMKSGDPEYFLLPPTFNSPLDAVLWRAGDHSITAGIQRVNGTSIPSAWQQWDIPDDLADAISAGDLAGVRVVLVLEHLPEPPCRQLASHTDTSGNITLVDMTDLEAPTVTAVIPWDATFYETTTWAGGALIGVGDEAHVFDVTNPSSPQYVKMLPSNWSDSFWGNGDDLFIFRRDTAQLEWWDASDILGSGPDLIDSITVPLTSGEAYGGSVAPYRDSLLLGTPGDWLDPGYQWHFRGFKLDRSSGTISLGDTLLATGLAGWSLGYAQMGFAISRPVVAIQAVRPDGRHAATVVDFSNPSNLTQTTFSLSDGYTFTFDGSGAYGSGLILSVTAGPPNYATEIWVTDFDGNLIYSTDSPPLHALGLPNAVPNTGPLVVYSGDGFSLNRLTSVGIELVSQVQFDAYFGEGVGPHFMFSPPCVHREGCVGCWYVGMVGIGEFKTSALSI